MFAGIGGVELGLSAAGHTSRLLCEWDDAARRVLRHRFSGVDLVGDVRDLRSLPDVDLISAGFPCQDLSQAGTMAGIRGARSGLVSEVFRLLEVAKPRWLLLENVPFMLQLDGGEAMRFLTTELSNQGYRWAYRVVDSRAFGLPQRRRRVILLASRTEDPRSVLLADDTGPLAHPKAFRDDNARLPKSIACGFYWTEGTRGLGWATNAVPTLKGGSGFGIPSPPAIVLPARGTRDHRIVTPHIRDAERLQGFVEGWTEPAEVGTVKSHTARWKLVGNAVSVPVFEWVGRRLREPAAHLAALDRPMTGRSWPTAAWSMDGTVVISDVSEWPETSQTTPLHKFLQHEARDLSLRATTGFLRRFEKSGLGKPDGFIPALKAHITHMKRAG
ncbi:MAG TPA: DNA (cytosine-5-)-methyltransferase [Kofleriaceae bacterium]